MVVNFLFLFPSVVKSSKAEAKILAALRQGATLKSHRYLDGSKVYQLHPLQGQTETVPKKVVEALQERGFLISNQKFPAATYSLTEQGQQVAELTRNWR